MSLLDDNSGGDDLQANIVALVERIEEEFKPLGIYLEQVQPMGQASPEMIANPRAAIAGGEHLPISFIFTFNKLALTDRVLAPDSVKTKDEFSMIVPPEAELLRDRLSDRLKEGKPLLDLGDD